MFITIVIIALLAITIIVVYNSIIKLKIRANNAWSDIDVQLKKRYDLINNLVETVKGYSYFEKSVLEDIAEKRSIAMNEDKISRKAGIEEGITGTLKSLFAVAENYPDLKANKNFLYLQEQLVDIENTISMARRYYNAVVRDYNQLINVFPQNIIAKMFGFKELEYFEVENEREREVVNVTT
ncbi:LemA family protein [candidate division WOR-3 bacterium]|nr:LemA family protein [candidate division WOR-3 bacterium]